MISKLSQAIVAGERLEAASNARKVLLAAYSIAQGSSMPPELSALFLQLDNHLGDHESALRDGVAEGIAEARNFKSCQLKDCIPFDVPVNMDVKRVTMTGHTRIAVYVDGSAKATVYTHEQNGDDVGGFVVSVMGRTLDTLYSTERAATMAIIEELSK